jgi:hypothetical protein
MSRVEVEHFEVGDKVVSAAGRYHDLKRQLHITVTVNSLP